MAILNLDDIQEAKPVPNGRYSVIVASAELKDSKAGKPQIVVSLGIEGHDEAPNVTHFISLPDGSDAGKDKFKGLLLKRFLVAFGLPTDAFDPEECGSTMPGTTASVELSLSEPDDNGSVYNRLQLPRLPSEDKPTGGAARSTAAKPPKR